MNFKLALSGLLSAALLAGCGSAPKLSKPEGQWEDMPFTHTPAPRPAAVLMAPPPVADLVQPVTSPAPEAPPLQKPKPVAKRKPRPVAASPAKAAEAPDAKVDEYKCSAN